LFAGYKPKEGIALKLIASMIYRKHRVLEYVSAETLKRKYMEIRRPFFAFLARASRPLRLKAVPTTTLIQLIASPTS
jgi:hypothetical protein